MGDRGPQAINVLAFEQEHEVERPQPESGMTPAAKKVWRRIVDELPADYFRPADLPLLRAYCESYSTHLQASKNLKKDGHVIEGNQGPKRNPWFDVQKEAASTMATLATKLRLCPNARISGWKAETETKQKPKSKRGGLMFNG